MMFFLLLIVVFGFYYVLYLTTVMHTERMKILPTLLYIFSVILFIIPFIFSPSDQNGKENYLLVLEAGIVFYGWIFINSLWKRPLKVKFEVLTEGSNNKITQNEYEQVESLSINLLLSKYKFYISLCTLIVLFITTKIYVTPDMIDGVIEGIQTIVILLFFVIIVYFIIDIILWVKRKKFAFITLKPIFVIFLFILLLVFLP